MEKVFINGDEYTKEQVYDLACELDHSILTDDGKEVNNPTPTKEIIESKHVSLKQRLLRVLRQGDPHKVAIIQSMSKPPNLDIEADFEDTRGNFEAQEAAPFKIMQPEPVNPNVDVGERTENDGKTGTPADSGSGESSVSTDTPPDN